MRIPSGTTDQYIYFVAVDATDFTTRETGLSSFTVYRARNGAAAAAMTTPTINEVDATNMPGVYELLLDEDMTIASGNDTEEMVFHITHAGMAPVDRTIELYRPKITAGETLTVASGIGESDLQEIDGNAAAAGRLRQQVASYATGTVQSDSGTTITLDAGGSAVDDFYNGGLLLVYAGTGAGQAHRIRNYVGSSKEATLSDPFSVSLSSDSDYLIIPEARVPPEAPRKNIALSDIAFYMADATDGHTAETGLTVTAEVSKDGAAFAAAAGTVTEIGNGVYHLDATAADMNADVVLFRFSATGARDAFVSISTVE